MKLNILMLCIILVGFFIDILAYLKGIPANYHSIIGADINELLLVIIIILLTLKNEKLKEKLNDRTRN